VLSFNFWMDHGLQQEHYTFVMASFVMASFVNKPITSAEMGIGDAIKNIWLKKKIKKFWLQSKMFWRAETIDRNREV